MCPSSYGQPYLKDEQGNPYIALAYSREYAKICGPDAGMKDDEVMIVITYLAGTKKCVIERETDILTPGELKANAAAVEASILEELKLWVNYRTFKRVLRKGIQNIMTSKYVAKWKFNDTPDGRKRMIRMRMTIRGFQDWFAHLEENYSGTASRQSQRLLCSETACHPHWEFVTVDVEKAFLQGMTHEEIEASTGEKQRKAYFNLPPGSAALLRKIPGFEDFDERYECLESMKHGTGTKGAPRAFSLKLAGVTQGPKIKMKALTFDREMEVRHDNDKLVASACKHVDDIKYGAEPDVLYKVIIPALEEVFGKLKINKNTFTNTGVRHTRQADGTIVTDQDEYIQALKPITNHKMVGKPADDDADDELTALFWSLLGAAAYAIITQFWLAVYIVSLQRNTSKPKILHLRRLNAVIRVAQKRPAKLTYLAMTPTGRLECHADSGFSKEQDKGYGIRGMNMMREGKDKAGQIVWHLLDSVCRGHKHVTRCSFSSETRGVVIAADDLIATGFTLEEMKSGVIAPAVARAMMEAGGGCTIEKCLVTDSMSLFSAISAIVVRVPTEKNLAVQLYWLRQMLDIHLINKLRWADTRDMNADGHTKGSIPRDVLLALMAGHFSYAHPTKDFVSSRPMAPRPMARRKYDPTAPGHCFSPYAHLPEPGSHKWRGILHAAYAKWNPDKLKKGGVFDAIMRKYKGKEHLLYEEMRIKYEGAVKGVVDNRQLAPMQCRICLQIGHMGNECPTRKPGYRAQEMPKKELDTDEPAPQPQTFSGSIFGKLLSLVEDEDADDSGVLAEPVDTTAAAASSAEEHQGLDPHDPLAEFFEEGKSTGLEPAAGNVAEGLDPSGHKGEGAGSQRSFKMPKPPSTPPPKHLQKAGTDKPKASKWQPEDFGLHPDGSKMSNEEITTQTCKPKSSSSAKGSVKRFLTEDEADAALGKRRPPGMPRMIPIEASDVQRLLKDQKRGLEPQVEDPARKVILLSRPKQAQQALPKPAPVPVRLISRAVAEAVAQPLPQGRITECNEANYKPRTDKRG